MRTRCTSKTLCLQGEVVPCCIVRNRVREQPACPPEIGRHHLHMNATCTWPPAWRLQSVFTTSRNPSSRQRAWKPSSATLHPAQKRSRNLACDVSMTCRPAARQQRLPALARTCWQSSWKRIRDRSWRLRVYTAPSLTAPCRQWPPVFTYAAKECLHTVKRAADWRSSSNVECKALTRTNMTTAHGQQGGEGNRPPIPKRYRESLTSAFCPAEPDVTSFETSRKWKRWTRSSHLALTRIINDVE